MNQLDFKKNSISCVFLDRIYFEDCKGYLIPDIDWYIWIKNEFRYNTKFFKELYEEALNKISNSP